MSPATAAAFAVVLGAMAAIMFASHRPGHWWGDDWALYVHQAQGLLDGHPGRVIDANLFTVDNSRGPAFSPPLYPWGFPLLLAPFVAVIGQDLDRLTIVPVLCSMVFAACWFALARDRIGRAPAFVGVVAVTLTPVLLGWTELIQSEWPFLAATGVVLVALDRLATRNTFLDTSASLWPLALVGIGAAAAFSVRREGLALVGAIAAAQLALFMTAGARSRWTERRVETAVRLSLPYVSMLAVVAVVQLILPSTLVPQYAGTSVRNVWSFRRDHVEHLAEVSGLKRAWQPDPVILGSSTIGWIAVVAYLTAAVAGIVMAVIVYRRRDLHLVAYAAGALLIGGSFRSPINRYVCTVAPILVLLGASALAALARFVPWRHASTVLVASVLGLLAVGNLVQARTRIDTAEAAASAGAIEWGPTHPLAVEMFGAVERLSDDDDVIAAPKARAMTLLTGRLAVQVDDYRPIPVTVPIALVVVERGSDLHADLAGLPGGYRSVWDNGRFVIYRPT